jgi:thiol-disulfide isomerase/thioredoxin
VLRRGVATVVAIIVIGLLAAGCGFGRAGDGSQIAGNGAAVIYPAASRTAPVHVEGTTLAGAELSSSAYLGRTVVVNVWWAGCPPCSREAPLLVEAERDLGRSVAFFGIDTRDHSTAEPLSFERANGVTYPSIYSPGGSALLAFPSDRAPGTMPATVVLDKEGRVAALFRGEIPSLLTLEQVVECVRDDDDSAGCRTDAT